MRIASIKPSYLSKKEDNKMEEIKVTEETVKKTRPKKNNMVLRHKEICKKLNRIYEAKNNDYGNSFGDTYKQLGIASALVRISDKYNRLMSLGSGKKQMVNDESIRDTLEDLANYCVMTIMELDREAYNAKKKEEKADESIS